MSKEQTLTAHDFYNSNFNLTGYELMEQYAQAKVLEALERYEDKILKVVEKKADVKDYILRNRSKTKV